MEEGVEKEEEEGKERDEVDKEELRREGRITLDNKREDIHFLKVEDDDAETQRELIFGE